MNACDIIGAGISHTVVCISVHILLHVVFLLTVNIFLYGYLVHVGPVVEICHFQ